MLNRRAFVVATVLTAPAALVGCEGGVTGAAAPTATVAAVPTVAQPFLLTVRMNKPEARIGQDENIVVLATFRRSGTPGPGVAGAQIVAIANYPGGPQTFTSPTTTFSDGRADVNIPVAPARGASTVRVEVVARYQGQEFAAPAAGFAVR